MGHLHESLGDFCAHCCSFSCTNTSLCAQTHSETVCYHSSLLALSGPRIPRVQLYYKAQDQEQHRVAYFRKSVALLLDMHMQCRAFTHFFVFLTHHNMYYHTMNRAVDLLWWSTHSSSSVSLLTDWNVRMTCQSSWLHIVYKVSRLHLYLQSHWEYDLSNGHAVAVHVEYSYYCHLFSKAPTLTLFDLTSQEAVHLFHLDMKINTQTWSMYFLPWWCSLLWHPRFEC